MEHKSVIDVLWHELISYPWFDRIQPHSTSPKTLVVYVDYMDDFVLRRIPDTYHGFDIQVHYRSSIDTKYAGKAPSSIADFYDADEDLYR